MLATTFTSAQYNLPADLEVNYCNHLKAGLDQQRQYDFPVAVHPLLEDYDVHFYFLDIQVENNSVYVSGEGTIGATVTAAAMDTFAFELIEPMTVLSVEINGIPLSFNRFGDLVFVPLGNTLAQGQQVSAKVAYQGTPPTGGFFSGISTDYNSQWDKYVTWTLSEPYAAKDWFPVKQDLTDKADSVWVFVTTSQENMVGSQGLLTNVTGMPGSKLRYEWKTNYPTAYYLISISIADYQDYSVYAHPANMDDSVLVQNFIYNDPGYLSQWQSAIDVTTDFIELFSEKFGPYPFTDEKYGHCVAEIGGGMEHQTMTTLGGFNFGLVAHELGHMWFGDNVTCAAWNDIWVNEGFATYSDYLAHHFLSTPYYDSLWLKIRHDHVKSQPGGSVYVPDSLLGEVWRIFDGRLSYSKGALLLHMIRFELQDDDLFFDILTEFGVQYGDSVATGMDFKELVENMSGEDFDVFFDQWYFGEGYPIFDIKWNHDLGILGIESTQTGSTSATPFFAMTVPIQVRFMDGTDTTIHFYQSGPVTTFSIPIYKNIEALAVDPEQWILHKLNSLTVVVEDLDSPVHFSLGPNPTSGRVHLFISKEIPEHLDLMVMDVAGRPVFRQAIDHPETVIDLAGFAEGIYIFRLSDGVNSVSRRVMKLSDH